MHVVCTLVKITKVGLVLKLKIYVVRIGLI